MQDTAKTEEKVEESKIVTYQDFLPSKKEINIAGKELVVKEYNIAKRDAVVKVLLGNLEVASLVKPFAEVWRERSAKAMRKVQELVARGLKGKALKEAVDRDVEEGTSVNFEDLAEQAKVIGLKLLSNDLSLVACVTLDIEENRKVLGVTEDLVRHPDHGFMHSPAVFRWVRENMLPRFEPEMIKTLAEVNDFSGLVKNWTALVVGMMSAGEE